VPSAGSYKLNFRIATPNSGAQLQVKSSSGTVLATVGLTNTGAYQNWQTVSTTVTLAAGTQTIRVQSSGYAGWNFNYMELAGGTSGSTSGSTTTTTTSTSGSTKVEAENYTNMSGVQTETTYDAGGGKNVGWIDPNDWMDYAINPSTSGTYTMNFRVATSASSAQFQVRKADGTVLATVNVPNTGGYQNWQTVSATVNLSAGGQTIRLVSTSPWGNTWNINWFEIVGSGAALAMTSQTTTTATTVAPTSGMTIFPNPVSDKFVLQVDNNLTGALDVQILSLQGAVLKQFSMTKTATGSSQFYVSIGDLATGTYVVKASMSGWTQSQQVSKL
jgi:endoglucanase